MEGCLSEARDAVEADNQALADAAECASPVAHEMNNFLNSLLLHLAVLQAQLPPEHRTGLDLICREAKGMATLVHQWQNCRRRGTAELECDLNQAVRVAVDSLSIAGTRPTVRVELSGGAMTVRGPLADLARVCSFLVRHAVAVTPADGAITVRTKRCDGKIILSVEDAGPSVAPEQLGRLFDPHPTGRDGTDGLELAACKGIARRSGGSIRAENQPGGGVRVTIELAAAPQGK
jgi:signal transduction histidine kinase